MSVLNAFCILGLNQVIKKQTTLNRYQQNTVFWSHKSPNKADILMWSSMLIGKMTHARVSVPPPFAPWNNSDSFQTKHPWCSGPTWTSLSALCISPFIGRDQQGYVSVCIALKSTSHPETFCLHKAVPWLCFGMILSSLFCFSDIEINFWWRKWRLSNNRQGTKVYLP